MFSPDVNPYASTSTRNPRRRQRTGSDDSAILRQNPKRLRRSGLTSDTFIPPPSKKLNGYVHTETVPPPFANGHVPDPRSQRDASVDTASLAIRNRGPKKGEREKRSNKSDGSIELVRHIVLRHFLLLLLTSLDSDQKRQLHRDSTPDNPQSTSE